MPDAIHLPPNGTVVRAKRRGWDEVLTPEQEFDMESYEEHGYASDDLLGPIRSAYGGCVLVGGQEADPKTIEVVGDE